MKRKNKDRGQFSAFVLIGFCIFCRCFLLGCLLTALLPRNTKTIISEYMGIDVSRCEILQESESHGGFLGDGQTYVELQATEAEFHHILEDMTDEWKKLPLTENISKAVYGSETETEVRSPLISGEKDGSSLIPPIENGYYYFTDRNELSSDPADDSKLFDRYSWNFTLVICDQERRRIYYVKYDT